MHTESTNRRRCRMRIFMAFAAGAVVSVSMASWASFQYEGMPPVTTPTAPDAGSTVYLANRGSAGQPQALSGFQQVGAIPGLEQKGAGIAWPCHGSGEGPLNAMLYRLLPAGWKLYAKPGTVLDMPTSYDCAGSPWTVPVDRMLRAQDMSGTLWWGYDILAIAPVAPPPVSDPQPLPNKIQPGGPMLPAQTAQQTLPLPSVSTPAGTTAPTASAKPNLVAACTGHGMSLVASHPARSVPVADPQATPLTIGAGGKVVSADWHHRVIFLRKAVREHWQLAISRHPTPAQRALARAWLANGGVLFYPLPKAR